MKKKINSKYPPLTKAYEDFLDLISNRNYKVRTVYEHYVLNEGNSDPDSTIIILRVDVDFGFHLSEALASHLNSRGLRASHYFLTFPERYYNLWGSKIPSKLIEMNQEVGIHNDHLYYQLKTGKSGIARLKKDIRKLSSLSGCKVKGSIFHGHNEINKLDHSNWELTKDISPSSLNLKYHDGFKSKYIKKNSLNWDPECDKKISDYMGFPSSWGWNYTPSYPCREILKYSKPNKIIHVSIHTHNAFKYWNYWTKKYCEKMPKKDSLISFTYKKIIIHKNLFFNLIFELISKYRLGFIKDIIKFFKN